MAVFRISSVDFDMFLPFEIRSKQDSALYCIDEAVLINGSAEVSQPEKGIGIQSGPLQGGKEGECGTDRLSVLAGFSNLHRFIFQMAKFNAVAKVTHSQYGSSSTPANVEIFQNDRSVKRMAAHRGTISNNPANELLKPKKSGDQAALRAS